MESGYEGLSSGFNVALWLTALLMFFLYHVFVWGFQKLFQLWHPKFLDNLYSSKLILQWLLIAIKIKSQFFTKTYPPASIYFLSTFISHFLCSSYVGLLSVLQHTELVFILWPLPLFSLPRMLFPQNFAWLVLSYHKGVRLNVTSSMRLSLTTLFKMATFTHQFYSILSPCFIFLIAVHIIWNFPIVCVSPSIRPN